MATSSQVKTGLNTVASIISAQRAAMEKVLSNAANVSAALTGLPADNADLMATINAYGTSDDFEAVAKAELEKMTAEFQALKVHADAVAAIDLDA